MYTADDVRNVRFPNRMNGYSKDEVDAFLDGVEEDYRSQTARIAELEAQVASLQKEIETLSISQSGIQNVLIPLRQRQHALPSPQSHQSDGSLSLHTQWTGQGGIESEECFSDSLSGPILCGYNPLPALSP